VNEPTASGSPGSTEMTNLGYLRR